MVNLPNRYAKETEPIKGGFGSVTICKDNHLHRKVVIKEIIDSNEIDRLYDEVKALQKLKSKHVVEIYDLIMNHGKTEAAIVEEFLPGEDLTDYRYNEDNPTEFIRTLYQLSSGLSEIHTCDIVHRDFKHNNVKYDNEGLIKIFDFGLAKCGVLPTSTTGIIGTPGFMAPELFLDPPVIDKPVDCYAFGALAFYFVLGHPPYCAMNIPTPRSMEADEGIEEYTDIDHLICEKINRCLDLNPNNRPSMIEISHSLKRELLYDKHKATLVLGNNRYVVDNSHRGVKISGKVGDTLSIYYDGYGFIVRELNGDVFINSLRMSPGAYLPGSSVIILGRPDEGSQRKFVTFDISYPEVVL